MSFRLPSGTDPETVTSHIMSNGTEVWIYHTCSNDLLLNPEKFNDVAFQNFDGELLYPKNHSKMIAFKKAIKEMKDSSKSEVMKTLNICLPSKVEQEFYTNIDPSTVYDGIHFISLGKQKNPELYLHLELMVEQDDYNIAGNDGDDYEDYCEDDM